MNATLADIATGLSNALTRDNQAGMTGPLRLADGTLSLPGMQFGSDVNTGFRRSASDVMRWVAGGIDRMYIDADGKALFIGAMDVAGNVTLQGDLSVAGTFSPTGGILGALNGLTGLGIPQRTDDDPETWVMDRGVTALVFSKSNGGEVLATGIMGDGYVPFACEVTGWVMLGDQSGSAVVDIWREEYADYPADNSDSMTGSVQPTISGAVKGTGTTLTGWTTSLAAGDCLRYNLDSVASLTRLTVILLVRRY